MKGGKEFMKAKKERKAIDMDDVLCPICGEYKMKHFGNVCPVCGWEHTPTAFIDPDFLGGANQLTANDYKKLFKEIRKDNPEYRWDTDPAKFTRFSKTNHIL